MSKEPRAVAICIPTCGRPEWMRRLLNVLAEVLGASAAGERTSVIVCDNDPRGTAEGTVKALAATFPRPLRYVHEPQRGISFARNALVRAALDGGADAVLFIDDDEVPDTRWLDEMLDGQRRYDADVVIGPVLPDYEPGTPRWVIDGGFFDRVLAPAGTPLPTANSGNTLVLADVFRRVGWFDPRFALTGAEDTHFFMRAKREGAKIVTQPTAIVHETVPRSRGSAGWLMRRAFRGQSSYIRCERDLLPVRQWLPKRLATSLARMPLGLGKLLGAVVGGRAMAVRGLREIARSAGGIAGIFGASYREYQDIHGR